MPAHCHPAATFARVLLALFALAAIPPALAQATEWATAPLNGSESPDLFETRAASRDASGNAYLIGQCSVVGFSGACVQRINGGTGANAWTRFLQWGAEEEGESAIAVDASGNVIAAQRCDSAGAYGYCLAKLDGATGDSIWHATLPGGAYHLGGPSLAIDASGNAVLAGLCGDQFGTNTANPCAAKFLAVNGSVAWTRHLDWDSQYLDKFAGVAVDASGNAIVAGTCRLGTGASAFYGKFCAAKLAAADGATAWQVSFNGPSPTSDDEALHLALTAGGDVLVAGGCGGNACVVRLSGVTGAAAWSRVLGAATFPAVKVRVDSGGHVLVLSSCTPGATGFDICVERLDAATGSTLWSASHTSPGAFTDEPADLVAGSGVAYVTGSCGAAGPPSDRLCTLKLDLATGGKPWVAYHAPGAEAGLYPYRSRAVVLDGAGNPITLGTCREAGVRWFCAVKHAAADAAEAWSVMGYVFLPANVGLDGPYSRAVAPVGRHGGFVYSVAHCGPDGNTGLCLQKVNESTGTFVWGVSHESFAAPAPVISAGIAFAPNGDPIVAATCLGAVGELCAIRFSAANGAIAWKGKFTAPGSGSAFARGIATDPSGNAFVTGSCFNASGNEDMCTVAFAAANGAVLWSQLRNGTQDGGDEGTAVLYLPNGVVAVTGRCTNAGTNSDICTSLYSAAAGTPLWNAAYGRPGAGRDEPRAMATDDFHLYVAGKCDAGGHDDYCTLKISVADGSLAWASAFASPGGMDDEPAAIAVGPDGDPVVFGTCYPLSDSREFGDLCTVKLNAATGSQRWMARYITGRTNVASAGTIDPEGNPVIAGECAPNLTGRIDLCAVRYAGLTGAQQWFHSSDAGSMGYAAARGALAAPGFLILAGEYRPQFFPNATRLHRVTNVASAPTVVSSSRASPNPTSLLTATFNVVFSEAVTGVDAADFSVTTTGSVTGATVAVVSGSGSTRSVTVTRTGGQGTLRLNVIDNDSIVDAEGNPLNGLGVSAPFTAGQSYDVHPPVTVTTTTLPNAIAGTAYSQSLAFSGGAGSVTFGIQGGSLPPGIGLQGTGLLSGTPTLAGTYDFSVTASDIGGSSHTRALTLVVLPATSFLDVFKTGLGTVTSSPAGIACGATCGAAFATGSTVSLGAVPAPGYNFAGWSGAGCPGTGTCVVTMDGPQEVGAVFVPASFTLTVNVTGVPGASVLSAPAGIDCPGACAVPFANGQVVTLTATPGPGSLFSGWSGACTGTGACTVTMSQARTVTAAFALDPAGDSDGDGIPNGVEPGEGRDPFAKDNDVFANARLFAMQMYRDFLSREGDPAGITGWTDLVTAGTYTRNQVIDAFLSSDEFAGFVAPVVRLYFATFLRVPDYDGLVFNAGLIRNATLTPVQLADFFANSPEFLATYGPLDNAAFVTLLYDNVLGRAPDPDGLNGWVALLDGGMSRGQVLYGFAESPEYQAAMAHEVFVTMMYAGMLRRTPEPSGFSGWVQFLDAGTYTREQVINGFFLSTEYHGRFLP